MQKYIYHLLQDIEESILNRWAKCQPHFFGIDIGNPYLKAPEGLESFKQSEPTFDEGDLSKKSKEIMEELEFSKHIAEAENYIEDEGSHNMYYYFGLEAAQFPPIDRLSEHQLEELTHSILRLWATFNYTAVFPNKTPARIVYPLLIAKMHKPTHLFERGNMGVEFCDYDPNNCPFGEYCTCKDYDSDNNQFTD